MKSKTQGFFYASDGSIYSFSILKSDPEDSRSDIRQVNLEKLHNIHQSNLKNQSYGVDNIYLFEPELVYVPTLKGCLLYDSYQVVHYLPDYSPTSAPDITYNPSYKPQVFIKGIKSSQLGFGSHGKMMSVSQCGNYLFLKKSINSLIRVDLKQKIKPKSSEPEKSPSKLEIKCDDMLIVDFSAVGTDGDLIVLGDKCKVYFYTFTKSEEGTKTILLDAN
jgi:hypothetical protein